MTKKTAFVFPGQGSQSVGMLSSFAEVPLVNEILDRANAALGFDLKKLIAEGPAEELNLTVNTQPALLTASYAMYSYWRSQGGEAPSMMAGHSLGEYSALVCSGAISFEEGLRLVRFRAEQMQEAVPVGEGSMAAILGLSDEDVIKHCEAASEKGVVEAVNFNTPGQVVIAGRVDALNEAMRLCKEGGAKRALPLKVSGPFHSSLMKPAAEKLAEKLASVEIRTPEVPVLHNVDVKTHESADEIRAALSAQVASAVLWSETVRTMSEMGVEQIYECGPGAALTCMVKRIVPGLPAAAVNTVEAIDAAVKGE